MSTKYDVTNTGVWVERSTYERLIRDSKTLSKLYAAGVDNWDGYDYAFDDEEEDEDE